MRYWLIFILNFIVFCIYNVSSSEDNGNTKIYTTNKKKIKNKKVSFKENLVNIIDVESYKKYNENNECNFNNATNKDDDKGKEIPSKSVNCRFLCCIC